MAKVKFPNGYEHIERNGRTHVSYPQGYEGSAKRSHVETAKLLGVPVENTDGDRDDAQGAPDASDELTDAVDANTIPGTGSAA